MRPFLLGLAHAGGITLTAVVVSLHFHFVSSLSKQNGHCCWLVLKMMYLQFVRVNSLMLVKNNVNLGAGRDSS